MRRYLVDPASREQEIESLLQPLGLWDLDVTDSQIELEAAAEACRVGGTTALPYPIAERLASGSAGSWATLVDGPGPALIAHGDLEGPWQALDLAGRTFTVTGAGGGVVGGRLAPFLGAVEVSTSDSVDDPALAARVGTLQSWWLLGVLQRAVDDTRVYLTEREQFGRQLAQFQALRFQLADMSVAVQRSEELAKYTAWSLAHHDPSEQVVDAIALRQGLIQACETVLRGSHQLYGAMGFCDETDVSILSRLSHSVRRLPVGEEDLATLLGTMILDRGFRGPFATLGGPIEARA
ncbi:acyl-CoA dehydrogenase family protein [Nocardioides immobilis]|uniref:acyl-CoA dehydrogenase family protein n=1 Tax=Nocardioides immobilis TaxID=2049295 RepID=UPI0015FC94AD|nr:acyl-CoA dehydrogenase family protein [Nocardioides immobilis]